MTTQTALAALAGLVATATPAQPVALDTFRNLPRPAPTAEVAYGAAQSQGIDVFVPDGPGPHPVAILVHGGCWSATTAGREQLRHLGADLAAHGVAAWSVGYRRANEPGGGYPGTFQDVSVAIDKVRQAAGPYRFDLARTVLVGHSAGGHLSLWAVGRRAKAGAEAPFQPGSVISLAGVGDLQSFAKLVPVLCGPGIIERLAPPGAERVTSPAARPAPTMPVTLVSAELDRLVPPFAAHDYAVAMAGRQAATIEAVTIPGAGHFDLVTPGAVGWSEVRRRILGALGMTAAAAPLPPIP